VDSSTSLKGFATAPGENSWICIDFKTRWINPTHYSIRTRTDCDGYHPRSWVLEGSTDCSKWTILDTRRDTRELTGLGTVKTFSIADPCWVRWIRIRQTGPNSTGNHYLNLKSLEFFGSMTTQDPSA
jgi:hypothetical protein